MTWFRAGGGNGIPNQLKDNMDAVLNKKFGTSTTYPPGGWPDDVNLLGVLEEKTVSGAIAHVTDGADEVPIKSWEVTLPASLTGYSSLTCKQAKANLLLPNNADRSGSTNGIAYSYDKTTQTFSFNGTNGKTDANWLIFNRTEQVFDGIKIGATYYFSHTLPANMYAQITYKDTNNANHALVYLAGNASKNASVSFTIPSDFESLNNFQIGVARTLGAIDDTAVFMISAVASADYAPYEAPTTTTVSLGRTIYGGSVDVVNGTGTDGYSGLIALNSKQWNKTTVSGHTAFYCSFSDGYLGTGADNFDGACSSYDVTTDTTLANDKVIRFYYNSSYNFSRAVIRDDQYANLTGAEFQEVVTGNMVYRLNEASETPFTFTGISANTKLGVNNFWSDGDSQVTYRSSGTETIVAPDLTTKSITANGTYNASSDNADGYSQVTVNVHTTPIISETDWNNLTDAQKRTYGLVIIQQANSGYKRGLYVNGADYPVLEEYSDVLTTGLSLDVLVDTTYTIECCFYALGYVNDGHVMGTTTGNHRNFHLTTYNNMWYFEGDAGKADNQLYPVAGGMDITFRQEGDTAYMNGNSVGSIGLVGGGTFYALAQRGSTMTGNNYKYKYVKIWDANDNLIHDFRFMANKTMIDLVTLNTKTYT